MIKLTTETIYNKISNLGLSQGHLFVNQETGNFFGHLFLSLNTVAYQHAAWRVGESTGLLSLLAPQPGSLPTGQNFHSSLCGASALGPEEMQRWSSEALELPEMPCKLECLWKSVLVLQRQIIEGHKTMKIPQRVYPKMLKHHHSRHITLQHPWQQS